MKILLGFVTICCAVVFAQDSINTTSGASGFRGSAHFGPMPQVSRTVTGAPYSGEIVAVTVQTLGDGTHITRSWPAKKVYRDSFGRTREERSIFRGPVEHDANVPDPPSVVDIVDPAAQVRYTLDVKAKVAHRQAITVREPASRTAAARSSQFATAPSPAATEVGKQPQSSMETLEPQVIEGVLADGTRSTLTHAVDAVGNDRPITTMRERWMARDLKVGC